MNTYRLQAMPAVPWTIIGRAIYRHPRLMGGAIWDFVSPGLTERIRQVDDLSPFHTPAHLMGNARLVKEGKNTVLDLNGHDQWVEVYRADNVELTSNELTLTCRSLSPETGKQLRLIHYKRQLSVRAATTR